MVRTVRNIIYTYEKGPYAIIDVVICDVLTVPSDSFGMRMRAIIMCFVSTDLFR